ncbi:6-carboxyhexanoate--CoA ligase [Romboutsia sedimentorum]|uniref:6-carboxyhexanoate--CoA ligase n=1 Tax=Romboutsia sedimentorum TaxID=1368474 RepID=UPI0024DEBCFD|nr:6-carboxyhexanoate--CoA ligase [Romboutsia sedimentorum]MDK2587037.1 6-carboxyhexanoate--CoA ligase [Romboutsia sedimentorum]
MKLYSIKMRSSKDHNHISGAENIINEGDLEKGVNLLIKRALSHCKGSADSINIKIEEIIKEEIDIIEPLQVTTVDVDNYEQGLKGVRIVLNNLGIENEKIDKILNLFIDTKGMRGAILLDIHTMKRLEYDKNRGIRATYMDFQNSKINHLSKEKKYNSHFIEALALASKVINSPYIIGEICCSDDVDYTAGYIACKKYGYIRFNHLKKYGDINGGRIFLYDSSIDNLHKCINYIENKKVLIKDDIKLNKNLSYEELKMINKKG